MSPIAIIFVVYPASFPPALREWVIALILYIGKTSFTWLVSSPEVCLMFDKA